VVYESVCDYFLFDTKGELPGGNGLHFDWTILKDYSSKKPFFLSGGIGPNDCVAIASIIKLNLPLYAIDVNSKFEIEPGFKNIQSIKEFKSKLNNEISG
jgi:phosphoribosylanthranilate isomerase